MDQCYSHKTDNSGTSLKWNLLAFCYEQPVFTKLIICSHLFFLGESIKIA